MSFSSPTNIPNKHSRDLVSRLVPKPLIHNFPVTLNSSIGNSQKKYSASNLKKKQLPPLQKPTEKFNKDVEIEINEANLTKNPLEYVELAQKGLDPREFV